MATLGAGGGEFDCFGSASALLRRLHRREISCVTALQAYLRRVDALAAAAFPAGRRYPAIVFVDRAGAVARAEAADAALARGELWGPLHGLPMTVKEELHVAGWPTTKGGAFAGPPAREHCVAVKRLLDAGAVLFGKSNVPTGCIDWQTHNSAFGGALRNPYDPARSTGGSSGGAAWAVACGLTAAELGGDTAGSIRIPANFCGVWGLCSTFGRIPTRHWSTEGPPPNPAHPAWPGAAPHPWISLGPIARSADDLALLLRVLEGPDPVGLLPPPCVRDAADDDRLADAPMAAFRVGIWRSPDDPTLSDAVAAILARATDACAASASTVIPNAVPEGLLATDSYAAYDTLLLGGPGNSDAAEASRSEAMWRWHAFFRDTADVLVMPVTFSTAFVAVNDDDDTFNALTPGATVGAGRPANPPGTPVEEERVAYRQHYWFPHFAVLARLPAVAVPLGLSAPSATEPLPLPVGLQVLAPHGRDRRAIHFAQLLQTAMNVTATEPPLRF